MSMDEFVCISNHPFMTVSAKKMSNVTRTFRCDWGQVGLPRRLRVCIDDERIAAQYFRHPTEN
jgi:hypothetical protein